jgi:hypothetical protein
MKQASDNAYPVFLNPTSAAGYDTGLEYPGNAHTACATITSVNTATIAVTSTLTTAIAAATSCLYRAITCAVTAAIATTTPCLHCAVTAAIAAATKNPAPSRLKPVSTLPETLPSTTLLPLLVL